MEVSLEGVAVCITRSRDDAAEFIDIVRKRSGVPLALPTIRLVKRSVGITSEFIDAAKRDKPDYTIFLSSRAVTALCDDARECGRDTALRDILSDTSIVAIGPKTSAAVTSEGLHVAHVPDKHSSVGIGELMSSIYGPRHTVIIPRSAESNEFLRLLLEKIGYSVSEVYVYGVEADCTGGDWEEFRRRIGQGGVRAIIFTSASSVRAFTTAINRSQIEDAKIVAMGPFTSMELERAGFKCVRASVHTVQGALELV